MNPAHPVPRLTGRSRRDLHQRRRRHVVNVSFFLAGVTWCWPPATIRKATFSWVDAALGELRAVIFVPKAPYAGLAFVGTTATTIALVSIPGRSPRGDGPGARSAGPGLGQTSAGSSWPTQWGNAGPNWPLARRPGYGGPAPLSSADPAEHRARSRRAGATAPERFELKAKRVHVGKPVLRFLG